jgi:hypothetical protein
MGESLQVTTTNSLRGWFGTSMAVWAAHGPGGLFAATWAAVVWCPGLHTVGVGRLAAVCGQ